MVEKSIPRLNCDTTIISQEFSYKTLAFDILKADTNKIKSLFQDSVVLKMEKVTDEEGTPYYLHSFTDGVNEIVLFHNPDGNFFIREADINSDRVLLNKKISFGMKKDVFQELLKVNNIKCDTITIEDEEITTKSIYIFKNDKLREIKIGSTGVE
jgi:hypothetical protein